MLSHFLFHQEHPDFRDPLLVSLDFGLSDEDRGPILDESLPKSINKTVSSHVLPSLRVGRIVLEAFGRQKGPICGS